MIAGVLLAGGEGRRMGRPKGLVTVAGESLVSFQLGRLRAAAVRDLRIVVGKNLPAYLEVMPELAPCLVDDARCAAGPFGSLCAGIAALGPQAWEQLLVLPIDVPCCHPSVIGLLRGVSAEAAVPRYHGYGGHPVLLSRRLAESLLTMDPSTARLDHVLRDLPQGARQDVPVDDPDVLVDLNTPAALAEYEAKRKAR